MATGTRQCIPASDSSSRELAIHLILPMIIKQDTRDSRGFGEAKVAQPTCDKYMLCLDLTRLATFAKDTIDENKLNASLSFQIHGFSVTFFITRLRHDGIYRYIMQEIAHMTLPHRLKN